MPKTRPYDGTCPVCYELTPDVLAECGHALCHQCAPQCFRRGDAPRCPLCRTHVAWDGPMADPAYHDDHAPHRADDDDLGSLWGHLGDPRWGPVVRLYDHQHFFGGRVHRMTQGLSFADVRGGVRVITIPLYTPRSPLYLQPGDVVTHVNADPIESGADAMHRIHRHPDRMVWCTLAPPTAGSERWWRTRPTWRPRQTRLAHG